jgi:hypothetical protein
MNFREITEISKAIPKLADDGASVALKLSSGLFGTPEARFVQSLPEEEHGLGTMWGKISDVFPSRAKSTPMPDMTGPLVLAKDPADDLGTHFGAYRLDASALGHNVAATEAATGMKPLLSRSLASRVPELDGSAPTVFSQLTHGISSGLKIFRPSKEL